MRKIISVLILCSLFITALFVNISCGNSNSNTQNNSQNQANASDDGNADSQADTTSATLPPPDLPAINLGGANFVILSSNWVNPASWDQKDIGADAENGDTINDAVYKRNSLTEQQFNCKIIDNQLDNSLIESTIKKAVNAGDGSLDAVTIRLRSYGVLAPINDFVEFSRLKYNDLAKPWWDQNCVNDLSIDHKIFAVASDMTIMDKESTCAMIFNKKMQADYGVEDLYKLVTDGKWTLDKMLELCKTVSSDLDGNGIMDDKDAYGILYQRDSMTSFLSGCGEFIGGKDDNDLPILTLNTPKALDVLNKLYDILYQDQYCFQVMRFFDKLGQDFTVGMDNMFENNQALFMWIRMNDVEGLRNMPADFGILPIPKYDETQTNYLQTVNPYVGVVTAVPQSAPSIDNSSAVLEYMSYQGKYILQPAYYDIVLQTKIARDQESEQMLNIIFENRAYDIGDVFDFGGLGSDVINMSTTFDRDITSKIDKKQNTVQKAIDKLVANIQAID
ncbi:MAG: hypothetical protein FWD71_17965 [Oscillospiraceae bacterium]|nr:hypothetical protein [Oscillospiraceae bacterium]